MHSERSVKQAVIRRLKKYGAWHTMPHQSGFSSRGVPDILACYKGYFIAIECKFGKNKPTALQEQQLEKIYRAGGVAVVIDENNLDMVEDILGGIDAVA